MKRGQPPLFVLYHTNRKVTEFVNGMAKSEFTLAFNEITEAHHLPREIVIDALQQALVSAYRRDSGASPAQRVEADGALRLSSRGEVGIMAGVLHEEAPCPTRGRGYA